MAMIVLLVQVASLVLRTQATCDIWYDRTLGGLLADCSGKSLTSVPSDLPFEIVALNLQDNNIKKLTNKMFALFPKLKSLKLSNNGIEVMEKGAFLGLSDLVELDLSRNRYLDNESYPNGIFDPVNNLTSLSLEGVVRSGRVFPSYIFLPLSQLRELYTDQTWSWLEQFLGQCTYFNSLKSLNSLTLWLKFIDHLQNNTFTFLQGIPLQNFTIIGVLDKVDVCAFCPLRNLTYLKLDTDFESHITLKDVTHSFYGFADSEGIFNEIDLYRVQDTRTNSMNTVLDRLVMGYLLDMCVMRLDLSNNRLMVININTFRPNDKLTKCIRYLDLSRNYILFEFSSFFTLPFMTNLKSIDISQNQHRLSLKKKHSWIEFPQSESIKSVQVPHSGTVLPLPSHLEFLNISRIGHLISFRVDISLRNVSTIQVLDMSYNGILDSPRHVYGFSNIKYLDISGMMVDESFLVNTDLCMGLETLIARYTDRLPSHFVSEHSHFFDLTKLKQLDLSGNGIQIINERTFSKLVNVHTLRLSQNGLTYLSSELLKMPSLISLDLSFNSINVINKEERKLLDETWERQDKFSLNIFGNSFACACGTLAFIQWLHETRITLQNKGNYSCVTEYGTATFTTTFYSNLLLHWRQCVGLFWLSVTVLLQCSIIMCLMSAFLLKKYYPKMEHHILHILGYRGKVAPKRCDFTYDAYICYEDRKYQWPCLCLFQKLLQIDKTIKLYLSDLHDPPGNPKAEVTINAISKSWKLIIVVTEDLFTDEWSYFTVLTAVRLFSQEEVITSRILLLYQDISPQAKARVPRILLNVVPEENILEVKPGDDDFWAELHQMIVSENMSPEIVF